MRRDRLNWPFFFFLKQIFRAILASQQIEQKVQSCHTPPALAHERVPEYGTVLKTDEGTWIHH